MKRRGTELVQLPMPVKKKLKVVEEPCPSLDISFTDDEALPPGIIFTDIQQKKWRIGKPIGRGSFGRIYLVSDDIQKEVTKLNARYVVKIEPHTNGPLFVEIHCLIKAAQVAAVRAWRQQNKQKRLGMPVYIASGSFTDENTGTKYRFLVLPRYDIDLQKIITKTRVLDLKNVLVLALQILDVLEFLHNHGYTHSDIKSSNLMIGFDGNRIDKTNAVKPPPAFHKETKELTMLTGKPRRPKPTKVRSSNYYDDEDFIVNDKNEVQEDTDKRLASVKKKLRKFLSDKDSRTLHRHHAFNLRQISNYVNYEDLNSSICSDRSYQKLIDDFESKSFLHTVKEFKDSDSTNSEVIDIHKEAITSQSNGQIYLLDYGLASRFLDSEGNHKDFGMDARKAHDGTLEYSSRDSHIGAHSRRSDLETLGYNMLDWLTGKLPWKTAEVLAEPDLVHALKKNFMSDIKLLLKTCFKTEFYPQFIEKYLEYVTSLDFKEKPDYDYCRSLFRAELVKNGYKGGRDLSLNFTEPLMSPMSRKLSYSKHFGKKNTPLNFLSKNGIKKSYERENVCSLETGLKLELLKKTLNSSSDGFRKPCVSRNFFISDADLVARLKKSLMPHDIFGKKLSPKNLRSKKTIQKRKGIRKHRNSIGKFGNFMGSARQFTWAEILAGNPEDIIRKERTTTVENDDFDDETCKYRIRKLSDASDNSDSLQSPLLQKDYLQDVKPTYAMKEVIANFKKKVSGKSTKEHEEIDEGLQGYTPAMINVYRIKQKLEAKENLEAQKPAKCEPAKTRCTRSKRNKVTSQSTTSQKSVAKQKSAETIVTQSRVKGQKSTEITVSQSTVKGQKSTEPTVTQSRIKGQKSTENSVTQSRVKGQNSCETLVTQSRVKGQKSPDSNTTQSRVKGQKTHETTITQSSVKGQKSTETTVSHSKVKGQKSPRTTMTQLRVKVQKLPEATITQRNVMTQKSPKTTATQSVVKSKKSTKTTVTSSKVKKRSSDTVIPQNKVKKSKQNVKTEELEPIVTQMRVTRSKTSVDSNSEIIEEVEVKCKKKVNKKQKKEVKCEASTEPTPTKGKKKSSRKSRSDTIVPNRRRLRSYKRKKLSLVI